MKRQVLLHFLNFAPYCLAVFPSVLARYMSAVDIGGASANVANDLLWAFLSSSVANMKVAWRAEKYENPNQNFKIRFVKKSRNESVFSHHLNLKDSSDSK